MRTARSYAYGDATLTLLSNGLWDVALPASYNDANPANFVQLTAPPCVGGGTAPSCIGQAAVAASAIGPATPVYTVGQLPLTTPSSGVSYSPQLGESSERIAKLNLTHRTDELIPFIDRITVGGTYRKNKLDRWAAVATRPSPPSARSGSRAMSPR